MLGNISTVTLSSALVCVFDSSVSVLTFSSDLPSGEVELESLSLSKNPNSGDGCDDSLGVEGGSGRTGGSVEGESPVMKKASSFF